MAVRILLSLSLLFLPVAVSADEVPVFSNCFEETVLSDACQATKNEIDILLEATFEEFLDEEGFSLDESHISKAQYYSFIALLIEIHPDPDVDELYDAAYSVIQNKYGMFRQSRFDYMMGTEDRQESLVPLEKYAQIIPEHFLGIYKATRAALIAEAEQTAAEVEQTAAEAEQTAAEVEQTAAEVEQTAAEARARALAAAVSAFSGN